MRLTCSQKNLSQALNIASKAVDTNNTLPVLNNVHLNAEGKKLHFTSTNLEVAITYHIETEIEEGGQVTIPAKLLTSYVNYLKDGDIDIKVDGVDMQLKTNDSITRIKGIAAEEFPPIPNVEREGGFKIQSNELKQAIHQVVFAAALNTTRPILGGVYFVIEEGVLHLVSTDSYRLSEKSLSVSEVEGEIDCVIPAKTILELGAILDTVSPEVVVEVIMSKNQVKFVIGQVEMTSRLIEGKFPNYKQIIPQSSKTQVEFDVAALSLILKRINIFAKENNNKVVLKMADGKVKITTDSTQYGEGEIEVQAIINGDEGEIALNAQFLLEALGHLSSGKVTLEMGEKTAPVMLKPNGKADFVHIIMPLKI